MTLRIGAISYRYINDFSLFCVKLDPHNFYSFSSSSFSPIFFILARSNVERKTQRVLQRRPRGRVADFTRIRTGDDRREVYTRTVYLFIYFFFFFFVLSNFDATRIQLYFSRSASSELTHENSFYSRIS